MKNTEKIFNLYQLTLSNRFSQNKKLINTIQVKKSIDDLNKFILTDSSRPGVIYSDNIIDWHIGSNDLYTDEQIGNLVDEIFYNADHVNSTFIFHNKHILERVVIEISIASKNLFELLRKELNDYDNGSNKIYNPSFMKNKIISSYIDKLKEHLSDYDSDFVKDAIDEKINNADLYSFYKIAFKSPYKDKKKIISDIKNESFLSSQEKINLLSELFSSCYE
jgi:hypothetical protein